MLALFQWQAEYNRQMNEQFYQACAGLSDEERQRPMGAFFDSISSTLNHLLLGDKIWLGRLQNRPFRVTSLRQILHEDFEALYADRRVEDQRLIDYVDSLTLADLQKELRYVSLVDQKERCFRVDKVLTHLFLHQTHHRGQVSTLMSQLGCDFGETDILFMTPSVS